MKWLTLERIKQQLRIDSLNTEEDELLEAYGESAEESILNLLNRTYENIVETHGCVPRPIIHATLLLVDNYYRHRAPIESQSMSVVPYTFDLMLKPYAVL